MAWTSNVARSVLMRIWVQTEKIDGSSDKKARKGSGC